MTDANPPDTLDVERTLGIGEPAGGGRRRLAWIAAALAVLAAVVAAALVLGRESGDSVRYKTQEAARGDLTVTVTATGNLRPTNEYNVGIEVSGTLATVEVDFNDAVTVGQVLARLDTTKLQAQVLQSRAALAAAAANVAQAQATVREARAELERMRHVRELSGGRVPAEQDLVAAEAALKRAEATEASARALEAQAEATLKVNETDLAKAVVYSPTTGVVLARNVDPGQTVAASFQAPVLFTLAADLAKMQLVVDVDEADAGHVHEGQEATFKVDAYPERSFPARIEQFRYGPKEVAGVVTYEAVLEVDNADLALRPGMTATADIVVRRISDALLVPNAALRFAPPARERADRGASGGVFARIFPRPGRTTAQERAEDRSPVRSTRVWTLRAGRPEAVGIVPGATDGLRTEVLAGDLAPGAPLVVEAIGAAP